MAFNIPASFYDVVQAVGRRLDNKLQGAEHAVILYESENHGGVGAISVNSVLLTSTPTTGDVTEWMAAVKSDVFRKELRNQTDSPTAMVDITADKNTVTIGDSSVPFRQDGLPSLAQLENFIRPESGEEVVKMTFPIASLVQVLSAMSAMAAAAPNQAKEAKNDQEVHLTLLKVPTKDPRKPHWRILLNPAKPYQNQRIAAVVAATDVREAK